MMQSNKGEALRRMAGGLAHELNNLFTAINGNLQLVEYKDLPRETVLEIVADVLRSAAQGVALAQKLQAFCGHQELRPELFDLGNLVREVFSLPLLDGVDCQLALPPDPHPMFLDRGKIRALLTEIVANARAAVKAGGKISCTMRATGPGTEWDAPGVLLTICDTGSGVSPGDLQNVMDPMFTTKVTGKSRAGWGLSLAEGLVLQLGGGLTLAPLPQGGTSVEIYLPRPIVIPGGDRG